jgi:hypothetical protein
MENPLNMDDLEVPPWIGTLQINQRIMTNDLIVLFSVTGTKDPMISPAPQGGAPQ